MTTLANLHLLVPFDNHPDSISARNRSRLALPLSSRSETVFITVKIAHIFLFARPVGCSAKLQSRISPAKAKREEDFSPVINPERGSGALYERQNEKNPTEERGNWQNILPCGPNDGYSYYTEPRRNKQKYMCTPRTLCSIRRRRMMLVSLDAKRIGKMKKLT